MGRVVLPFIATAAERINAITTTEVAAVAAAKVATITTAKRVYPIAAADVGIAIEIVIAINVDIAAAPTTTPTPTAAPGSADRQPNAKRYRCGPKICAGPVIWRIPDRWIGITQWSIDISRVVRGHIDHLRIRLLDNDHLLALN